jgi:hypothetical protein
MGGKTATTTQSLAIPPEVLARYNSVNARAEQVAGQPFQQYGGQFVAPLTGTQQAGIGATYQAAGAAQPYYGAAAGLTAAGAGPVMPGELETQRYMSPYTGSVVDATQRGLEQQQGQQRAMQQSEAVRAGAFGGDRSGLQRAALMGQQGLATAQAISPLYQQAYQQAQQTAAQQQGVGLQAQQANLQRALAAGQQFGQLGTGAQQAGVAGAQALMGAGTLEQQTQQADLTARYQQFLQERGYPFQVAQFLANIAMGTGALSGSTTTTTQPAPFFSDEREKTNIKPLGKGLYAYDYIDDVERARATGEPMPPKRVGPMAQDIEARRPGLVVDINDYKVVAPARDSMGGAVMEPGAYDRGGYAPGGLVGAEDLRAILAAQQQFLGPYAGQGGPYGGQKQGQPGFVPQASLPVPKLVTAGGVPQQRQSELMQLAGGIQQAQGFGESLLGDKGLFGKQGLGSKVMEGLGKVRDIASPPPAVTSTSSSTGTDASAPATEEERRAAGQAYGGLVPRGYADGGMPYGGDPLLQGVIEEGKDEIRQLPKPGQPPGAPKGLGSELMDAAKLGTSLYGLGSTAASAAAAVPEALTALMAFLPFSDARLKDNIAPVGETYDGQQIYRYNMGDGRTQLGLMAQEVAQRKPDAVGERNGFLTLDYDRATEDAVPRAYGGLVPRSGYQAGGPPDDGGEGTGYSTDVLPGAIRKTAQELGVNPLDLATAISYETGGTFDPWQKGPTTRWGQHRGLIQWGEPQRQRYGVTEDAPAGQQMQAVGEYLRDRGVRPGMALPEIYSAINAGTVGRLGAVDKGTTVAQKLASPQMARHRQVGAQFLGLNPGDYPAEGTQEAQLQRPGAGQFVNPMEQRGQPAEGGLGAAARAILPTTKSPTGEESINWKQTLIPVLTGLGAMASSPSRYLGSAVLQGLGAGAQSYANLEKQQADIGQTQELTRTQQAETSRRWLAAAKDAMFTANGRQYILTAKGPVLWTVYAADPTKYGEPLAGPQARRAIEAYPGATPITPDVYGEGQRETPTPRAPGEPSAPGTPGAPGEKPGKEQAPQHVSTSNPQYVTGGPTLYTLVGTSAPRNIEVDVNRTKYGTEEEISANRAETKQKYANYRSMAENSSKLADQFDKLAQYALSLPQEGWGQQGPLNNLKTLWTGYANEVLRTAGVPTRITEADIGTGEAMRKLQSALSGQAGSRSDQALSTAMSSIPNISQSRDGFIKSYAPERVRMQKDMDMARYIEDYRREYEKKYGKSFPAGWSIVNAERSFKDDNPETSYVEDEKRMKWLMNTQDPRTKQDYWSSFRSNKYPQYYVDRLTRGVGYRRYFEGFRQ